MQNKLVSGPIITRIALSHPIENKSASIVFNSIIVPNCKKKYILQKSKKMALPPVVIAPPKILTPKCVRVSLNFSYLRFLWALWQPWATESQYRVLHCQTQWIMEHHQTKAVLNPKDTILSILMFSNGHMNKSVLRIGSS